MNVTVAIHELIKHVVDNGKYLFTSFLTTLAQMSMGQLILRAVDRVLWVVEKSAQWSLPYCETTTTEENRKAFETVQLVRPLPWVFFLPALIVLRIFRLNWNIGASIIGYPTAEPVDIVRVLQKCRRKLRTIKTTGMKNIRLTRSGNNRPVDKDSEEAKRNLIEYIQCRVLSLFCFDTSRLSTSTSTTRIQVTANHDLCMTPDEISTTESSIPFKAYDLKQKLIELDMSNDTDTDVSENETLNAKIDRLALENSADDEDFDPDNCTSESSVSSLDDADDLSQEELQEFIMEMIQQNTETLESIAPLTSFKDSQRNSSSSSFSKPIDIKPRNDTEEQRDYYSPIGYKSGDDGDADFYSPISSKSTSPERTILTETAAKDGRDELKGNQEEIQKNTMKSGEQILKKSNGHGESESVHPPPSPKKTQKHHQPKGKRLTQGNRKKK